MNDKNRLISIFLIITNIIITFGCVNNKNNNNTFKINNKEQAAKDCKLDKKIMLNRKLDKINDQKITEQHSYLNGEHHYGTISNNSSNSRNSSNSNNNENNDENVEQQLIRSAQLIEKSLATLAASQELQNIPVLNTAPLITPEGGMGHTADIDWTGPIEPLLKKVASMTNYNLKILGSPSPIPIIVSITQNKAIIADILKNVGLQAGRRANIVVFPANRIIELRYRFGSYNSQLSNNDNVNDNANYENN